MVSLDDTLNIDTPENVAFGYEIAGIGSRFLAALVDTCFILALQLITYMVIFLVLILNSGNLSIEMLNPWLIAALGLLGFIFLWGYYIYFEIAWNGQSPGKRWAGLRVIQASGAPITPADAVIRNLVRAIDFLPAYYGIGLIAMFLDKQSRRLGDLAAGTLVVREHKEINLESLSARPSIQASRDHSVTNLVGGLPVERLTDQDIALIESFLQRRDKLTNREVLAHHILHSLYQRMGIEKSAWGSLTPWRITQVEDLLVTILHASNQRQNSEHQ